MNLEERVKRFDKVAGVYRMNYKKQAEFYRKMIEDNTEHLEINPGDKILDMGCGNGSLSMVLAELEYDVIGVEASHKMLEVARNIRSDYKKHNPFSNLLVQMLWGDITERLPHDDKSFDAVFIANTARGMESDYRRAMYREASRLAKKQVIIIDYTHNIAHKRRFSDWIDQVDSSDFIQNGLSEMREEFQWVNEVPVTDRLSWYLCKP